jgi:uncharacterized repeat protein (TIGR02543 family)
VNYNAPVGDLPTKKKAGYTFKGWYSGDTKITEDTKVTGKLTLTPKFKKITKSASASIVNASHQKSVVKQTAKTNWKVKVKKTVKITLTKYKNVTVKSVSKVKGKKNRIKYSKGKNSLKIKRLKKGTVKLKVTLKNGNKKTYTIK